MFLSRTNQQQQQHWSANDTLFVVAEELDDPLSPFEQTLKTDFNLDRLKTFLLKYKKDDRYRNSPRYLKLWIKYVLYLKTAYILPILRCLIDNHIGDKLAMLYEAIAYYQVQENKFKEAEDTLLLGIKQRAEPTKRLERVLNQYYSNKTIPFDIHQYAIQKGAQQQQFHSSPLRLKESWPILKNESLENQLEWLDVGLQHSIRASVLRECHQTKNNDLSFEELKVKHLGIHLDFHKTTASNLFLNQIKNDLDDIYHAVKRRRTIHKKVTPPKAPPTATTPPLLQQVVVQVQPTIPTNPQEETANVTQLPHKSGFIQSQISSHGLLERDDYHIYENMKAQDILNKLRAWSSSTTHHQRIIKLGEESYHVVKKLGEGGMARVYLVENTNNHSYYGLKVQQPPHPWEFYIISELHKRRKSRQSQYFIHVLPVYHFYQYDDVSFMVMPYISEGTLLDILNLYRTHHQKAAMPEFVVLLFTLQLLKEITTLHSFHITHNDLKLDNIMLTRKINDRRKLRLPTVFMVDYGRSIDLTVLESPKCKANWKQACPQSDYPLLNQSHNPLHHDYWQSATIAHFLLFGNPMGYSRRKDGTYRIRQTIKRYWHKDLWVGFFQTMMNPKEENQANHDAIQDLIHEFEKFQDDVPHTLIQTFHDLLDKN